MLFDVDATKLEKHELLRNERFDKIMFNFPHVGGKMKISKNRELIRDFFVSCGKVLKDNGGIAVTLCKGQGGTPVDICARSWNDTWKIVEMAAHGDFLLTAVGFFWSMFEEYLVTGYRSLDKQFHTVGSLVHFFLRSEPPAEHNIAPSCKIIGPWNNSDNVAWKEITMYARSASEDPYVKCPHPSFFILDINLSVEAEFNTAEFYMALYNYAGTIVNNVELIDVYPSSNGEKRKLTYRIIYKSNRFPLYRKRVIQLHHDVIANFIEQKFHVTVSR